MVEWSIPAWENDAAVAEQLHFLRYLRAVRLVIHSVSQAKKMFGVCISWSGYQIFNHTRKKSRVSKLVNVHSCRFSGTKKELKKECITYGSICLVWVYNVRIGLLSLPVVLICVMPHNQYVVIYGPKNRGWIRLLLLVHRLPASW